VRRRKTTLQSGPGQDPQLNPTPPRLAQSPAFLFHPRPFDLDFYRRSGNDLPRCSLFDRNGRIQHNLARFWSRLVMKTILSPVTITGADQKTFDNSKPKVYAVTHASALDIPVLYVYLPFQFRIIFQE